MKTNDRKQLQRQKNVGGMFRSAGGQILSKLPEPAKKALERKEKKIIQYLDAQEESKKNKKKQNVPLRKRPIFEEEIAKDDFMDPIRKYIGIPDGGQNYKAYISNQLTAPVANALCSISPYCRDMEKLHSLMYSETGILALADRMAASAEAGNMESAEQFMTYLKQKAEMMLSIPLSLKDAGKDALVFPLNIEAAGRLLTDIDRLRELNKSRIFRSGDEKEAFVSDIRLAGDWKAAVETVLDTFRDNIPKKYRALKNQKDGERKTDE